jgi:hypothetical protein
MTIENPGGSRESEPPPSKKKLEYGAHPPGEEFRT